MKFKNKKVISAMICLFVTLILSINNMCYANINDNEIIDINETKKQAIETVSKNIENLKLNSRIGLIFDRNSKRILYEKNGLKQVPMASTTKIMTAIVVLENSELNDVVTISKKAAGTGAPKSSGGGGEGAGNQRRPGGSGASSDSESPSGLSGAGKSRRKA